MKRTDLPEVAGGGLIARRTFLASGFAFVSAIPALAQSSSSDDNILSAGRPSWMSEPGEDDIPYGVVSPHEADVVKHAYPYMDEAVMLPPWHTPIAEQQGIITPNGLHFGVHHTGIPQIDPEAHELVIHGLVERPLRFTMEALRRYPIVSSIRFLECAGNTAANALSFTPMNFPVDVISGLAPNDWLSVLRPSCTKNVLRPVCVL